LVEVKANIKQQE